MEEQSKNFNEVTGNIKKYQTQNIELKNTITEPKNSIKGFNIRLD